MNTELTNRDNMFKTVTAVLDDHNSIWNSMAPFATAVTAFKDKVAAIDATAQRQETPTGSAKDKENARNALEDVLFLMCEALGVLAHSSGDQDLLALTDVTRSGLDKMDAEALSNRATSVLAQANGKKTELATLQVTQANIDELSQALTDFNEAKAGPRQATAERSAQTDALPGLFREANDILRNQIDRMMSLFSRSNPDFVAAYKSARVIVDRAATRTTKAAATKPAPTPQ
jgi:hypothetical protein